MSLLMLILFKIAIQAPLPAEDEGIEVSFGNSQFGGGMPDVSALDEYMQMEQIPVPAAPSKPSSNDFMVQDDEESLALAKQAKEDAKRRAEEEELIRKRKEAEARAEAERVAKEKAAAEKRAKEQAAKEKANICGAMFGQAGTNDGVNGDDATAGDTGIKGNPIGKGFGETKDGMWVLSGRDLKSLPSPSNEFNQPGKVVVNIKVNAAGVVIAASVGDGTTVSDRATQQLALEAARRALFTAGEQEQIGSITYIFKLN